jgi:hypothetical protein
MPCTSCNAGINHKKHVSYVIKTAAGERVGAGQVAATRTALSGWAVEIEAVTFSCPSRFPTGTSGIERIGVSVEPTPRRRAA